MEDRKNTTVAFTGHRSYEGQSNEELAILLEELYERGYRSFLTGMAWGFDLAAGEAVMALKYRHENVEMIAVEPYAAFRELFHDTDAERYDRIKATADEVVAVSQIGNRHSYLRRNDYLVDNASVLIAWWDSQPNSGTAYTVKRAKKKALEVHNLCKAESITPLFEGLFGNLEF